MSARPVLLAACNACVQLFVMVLAIDGQPLWAMALHVLCCAGLAAIAWRRTATLTGTTAALRAAALMEPFLGPVAAFACLGMLVAVALSRDPARNDANWHEHLFPNLAVDRLSEQAEAISRQPMTDDAAEIDSFYDVLRWGSLAEQEHVLSLISRSFRPEFAPVLRAGLAVADLGLRAQAAAGLSLLEARTSARLLELQSDFERDGDLAVPLAEALSGAAHSGLYDAARNEEMREQIVTILSPLKRDRPEIAATLGRTLIQLDRLDEAIDVLEAAADAPAESGFSWLLEGLFRRGDFAQLEDLLDRRNGQIRTMIRADGPLAPALRFWMSPA